MGLRLSAPIVSVVLAGLVVSIRNWTDLFRPLVPSLCVDDTFVPSFSKAFLPISRFLLGSQSFFAVVEWQSLPRVSRGYA